MAKNNVKYSPELEKRNKMDEFSRLLTNLWDKRASEIQHSSVFINWQLQQASTDVHEYPGKPCMNIIPPANQKAIEYSNKRKAEFMRVYKHSTPNENVS